jgi:adenylate kinase family enzyme
MQRRLSWLTHLRQTLADGAATNAHLELFVAHADEVAAEAAYCSTCPEILAIEQELVSVESKLETSAFDRRRRFAQVLGLTDAELALLETLIVAAIDPSIAYAFSSLHGGHQYAYPTEPAILRLLRHSSPLLRVSSALVEWQLVTQGTTGPGEPLSLHVDPVVVSWYAGTLEVAKRLIGLLRPLPLEAELPDWPICATVAQCTEQLARGQATRVVVLGSPRSGRKCFARAIAENLGFSALAIDTQHVSEQDFAEVYLLAERHALLENSLLVWCGPQALRAVPKVRATLPLEFAIGEQDAILPRDSNVATLSVRLPQLTLEAREQAFRKQLPALAATKAHELSRLAERFPLELGDIAELGRCGAITLENVTEACRAMRRGQLGELGQQLECPFTRDDLTLPERLNLALDEILYEAKAGSRFWARPEARRLFPRGRGTIVLMSGPPGTGKTMAAQVIARELELDLVRIDLATTVSKYIGETTKNLKRIFERAAQMHAVILFDEADALFTKRTEVKDAHDRYANADTNYLLQLLESYPGIALLASNRRQNIDVGFIRRIRYALDFPRPGATERRRIWQRLVAELCGPSDLARLEQAILVLSQKLELSGAQIKLAVLAACFASQRLGVPISLEHLIFGAERELNKESRGVTQAEQSQLFRQAEAVRL